MDPSRARRDLNEVQAFQQSTTVMLVQRRGRWLGAGLAVFAVSMLGWLTGPGPVNIMLLALIAVCVLVSLLGRSPHWARFFGKRAQLASESAREARWLVTVTLLGVLAVYFVLNAVVLIVLRDTYPIAGVIIGLTLALLGPRFARWWLRSAGKQG